MAQENEGQEGFFQQAGAVVAAVYAAVMKGGEIQAAVRQGFNEIGAALQAFPDSIQVDEPGAVFNPLYSDIAADKRLYGQAAGGLPSPGEITGDSQPYRPEPESGREHGRGM